MSQQPKSKKIANSSYTNVDTLSADISKINVSNNGGDVLSSIDGGSGGDGGSKGSKTSSTKMDTSCEQKKLDTVTDIDGISDVGLFKRSSAEKRLFNMHVASALGSRTMWSGNILSTMLWEDSV